MRHPDPLQRLPRKYLDLSESERRERGRGTGNSYVKSMSVGLEDEEGVCWIFPKPPKPKPESTSHRPRQLKEQEAEERKLLREEYETKLLEARAWHMPIELPPFLPILYSDYILDEMGTIWRYDAKDRWGGIDHEVENAWSTLRVQAADERQIRDANGELIQVKIEEDMDELEAETSAEKDERNLKTLVKNLAERGAVRLNNSSRFVYLPLT